MKLNIIISVIIVITLQTNTCTKIQAHQYKGKLEVKGICMNYTIRLLEGNMDTSTIVASWKDEVTGKSYNNVFALGSPCTFPSGIKEGDEFYFTIDEKPVQNCAVCLAYYPKPSRSLAIKVIEK